MRKLLYVLLILSFALPQAAIAEGCTLTLAGEVYNPDIIESFLREHPEIEISFSERDAPNDWIADAITRSDEVDVYFLYTLLSTTFESLKNRGYLLALDDPQILAMTDAIYPEIMRPLKLDQGVCALPFGLSIQEGVGVNMDVWLELGLQESELPKTWGEFLRFVAEDAPELIQQSEELSIFPGEKDASDMLHVIENIYASYRAIQDHEIGYATPEFQDILRLFEQIDPDCFMAAGEKSIFVDEYIPDPGNAGGDTRYLPLSFKENESSQIPAGLMLMAVNPNSKHREAALKLVKYYFEHIEPLDKLALCPNENAPIVNDFYDDLVGEYENRMADYARRINDATAPDERASLELERDAYDAQTSALIENNKYLVSPSGIAQFRNEVNQRLVPLFCPSLSLEEVRAVNDKRIQFLQGHISSDQYISELERRFVSNSLEGQ